MVILTEPKFRQIRVRAHHSENCSEQIFLIGRVQRFSIFGHYKVDVEFVLPNINNNVNQTENNYFFLSYNLLIQLYFPQTMFHISKNVMS